MPLSQREVVEEIHIDLLYEYDGEDSDLVYELGEDGLLYAVAFSEDGEPLGQYLIEFTVTHIDPPHTTIGSSHESA